MKQDQTVCGWFPRGELVCDFPSMVIVAAVLLLVGFSVGAVYDRACAYCK
jgi:hypothetical protein